ncbi:ABC transporter permease [Kribbella turkmenica]|uniref:ABC transporter permease n=1 Tax=Kribbella turkmenica TaxID=2530375 RepID=A0A4R4XDM2_9ACTN|nr:ABC transporter permease [Kribbella turkmenica]TDD28559.1 ABC transporter permease [Kribbella turkmenica]
MSEQLTGRHPAHTPEHAAETPRRPPVLVVVTLLTVLLTVLLIAFAWPAARSEPRDLPLAVAGPAQAVAQVEQGLEHAMPGGFEVTAVPDRAAAVQKIEDRDVYGAIVLDPRQSEVLTASAGAPAVAQILTQLASRLSPEAPAKVTDVVPLPADDPRGAGLAAGALPLVLGGIAAAALLTQLVRSGTKRMVGAVTFAITGGLALAAVLQFWLGSFEGSYLANSGVIALSIAAVSLTLLGLEWLLGQAGLALGAAVMMLLGNPLSGLTSAPEMLPGGWGALGQLLPPGAAGTALRSVSFFDGAGAAGPLVVLGSWLLAGLVLCGLGAVRSRRVVPARQEAGFATV